MKNKNTTTVESGSALPVKIINHGDVWGDGNSWYTFYCPVCNEQFETKADCQNCNQKIDWLNATTENLL